MDNGNTFLAFLKDSIEFLEGKTVTDYYGEPLPSATDEMLSRTVDRFILATPEQREQFQSSLSQVQRSLFGIFGHRAATLSLRQESPAQLLRGLVGAIVSNYVIPEKRRVEVSLAIFHHCARKLGVNTVDLFEEAAGYATTDFDRTLIAFGIRSDITLRSFGWREIRTAEGVAFKFDWG